MLSSETRNSLYTEPKKITIDPNIITDEFENAAIRWFIKNNFSERFCRKITEKAKSKDLCICGKFRKDHTDEISNKEWTHKDNSTSKDCDTFGIIHFPDSTRKPKFIRFETYENYVKHCTSTYKLIQDYKLLKTTNPKFIISINSGYQNNKFLPREKKIFRQGLFDLFKKGKTWVIGTGYNAGTCKLVSRIVNEFELYHEDMVNQVSLMGIGSWNNIRNNEQLMREKVKFDKTTSEKFELDDFCDMFLLCDNGGVDPTDMEDRFSLDFQNYVKKKSKGYLVHILIDGGTPDIRTTYNVLEKGVPLVVMKGSGGLADIILKIMELPCEIRSVKTDKKLSDNISRIFNENSRLLEELKVDKEPKLHNNKKVLEDMYHKFRDKIVICDMMGPGVKFDMKILEAMIETMVARGNLKKILKLCIEFNCPDIANKSVFSVPHHGLISEDVMQQTFKTSLEQNQFKFVELFLENDFRIETVIDKDYLTELYTKSPKHKCRLSELLDDLFRKESLCAKLKCSYICAKPQCQTEDANDLLNVGIIIKKLSGNILNNIYEKLLPSKPCNSDANNEDRILTSQDLFLWALLMGHIDLSKVLWKIIEDPIGSALIASLILNNMAHLTLIRSNDYHHRKLMNSSKMYEDLATSIITESYNRDLKTTHIIISGKMNQWNNLSCIEIAVNGKMLNFLSHSACRSYTVKTWMGGLPPLLQTWKIILTIPFSLFLIRVSIYPSIPKKNKMKENHNHLRTSDINYKMNTRSHYSLSTVGTLDENENHLSYPRTDGTKYNENQNYLSLQIPDDNKISQKFFSRSGSADKKNEKIGRNSSPPRTDNNMNKENPYYLSLSRIGDNKGNRDYSTIPKTDDNNNIEKQKTLSLQMIDDDQNKKSRHLSGTDDDKNKKNPKHSTTSRIDDNMNNESQNNVFITGINNDTNKEDTDKLMNSGTDEVDSKNKDDNSYIKLFCIFHNAPIVKYYIYLYTYVLFVLIFCYMNLVELKPFDDIRSFKEVVAEFLVYLYFIGFIIEEIVQVCEQKLTDPKQKFKTHFSNKWNIFDMLIYFIFINSIVVRFTIPKDLFILCRCLFAITLSLFFLRSMQFYFVIKSIGPKVIMIGEMIRDIGFFLSIFVIFVLAYGTLMQSLKAPNSKLNLELLVNIVYFPYFQTYGELSLESFIGSGPCNRTQCIVRNSVIIISMAVFLLLTNILLINLLIAMFGSTFNKIHEKSEKLGCYIRIQLVQEFEGKKVFPPPFNILYCVTKPFEKLTCKPKCPKCPNLQEPCMDYKKFKIYQQICMETALIEYSDTKL